MMEFLVILGHGCHFVSADFFAVATEIEFWKQIAKKVVAYESCEMACFIAQIHALVSEEILVYSLEIFVSETVSVVKNFF